MRIGQKLKSACIVVERMEYEGWTHRAVQLEMLCVMSVAATLSPQQRADLLAYSEP